MSDKPVIPEQDKIFILALVGTGASIATGVLSTVNTGIINPDAAMKVFTAFVTLTTMGWTWYFSKKS